MPARSAHPRGQFVVPREVDIPVEVQDRPECRRGVRGLAHPSEHIGLDLAGCWAGGWLWGWLCMRGPSARIPDAPPP